MDITTLPDYTLARLRNMPLDPILPPFAGRGHCEIKKCDPNDVRYMRQAIDGATTMLELIQRTKLNLENIETVLAVTAKETDPFFEFFVDKKTGALYNSTPDGFHRLLVAILLEIPIWAKVKYVDLAH